MMDINDRLADIADAGLRMKNLAVAEGKRTHRQPREEWLFRMNDAVRLAQAAFEHIEREVDDE